MNEHPLDLHQELCLFFCEAFMQADTAARHAAAAKMQSDTAYSQSKTAIKLSYVAHKRFIAADKHYDEVLLKLDKVQSAKARKRFFTASRLFRLLSQKADLVRRSRTAAVSKYIAAKNHAAQLSKRVDDAFNTVFSGKRAMLL
jgi:hypothetical protein